MPGITAVIAKDMIPEDFTLEHWLLSPMVVNRRSNQNSCVERFTNQKFLKDKVFEEDRLFFVALEGVVFNFKELSQQYSAFTNFEIIKKMYADLGDTFMKELNGEFSGVLYDKTRNRWLVFTNHTSSKPIYFYDREGLFVASSELKEVCQVLKKMNRSYHLDVLGSYFILTYGFMLEDYTLIEEVKKLPPGHYLKIEGGKVSKHEYYRFTDEPMKSCSKPDVIETLDDLFKKAVTKQYDKDLEYGYHHIGTLSGGLDSRMNIMIAHEMGYRDILNITFCQSNYYDEMIAKQISADLQDGFLFCSLDNGLYLKDIESPVRANDGLVLYTGSAHLLFSIRNVNFDQYGLLHMGQLGDAVLGTFLTGPEFKKANLTSGAYSRRLLHRVAEPVQKIIESFENEEMYKMYNRGFNGVFNGNWSTNQFTECCSPFLDTEFLSYALTIPPTLKYPDRLYIEWILQKHPAVAKYVWERTKTKITTPRFLRFIRMAWKSVNVKVFGRLHLASMNPFDYWYKTNEALRAVIAKHFDENISLLDSYSELKKDCQNLYTEGGLREKTQALTLIQAMRMLFSE